MKWLSRPSRALGDWHEAIAPELRDLDPPEPSAELWSRIAASRAAGARVILPDVELPAPRASVLRRWGAAAACIPVIGVLVWQLQNRARHSVGDALQVASDLFSANVAFAESKASTPALPPLEFSNASAMRPGELVYERTWRHGGTVDSVYARLRMTPTTEAGTPAWLVVTRDSGSRDGQRTLQIDSLVLRRADLRLLRHTAIVEPYRRYERIMIRQRFIGDSVLGHMNAFGADATPAGRPIARRLLPQWGPYIEDSAAPLLLSATHLHEAWVASASMIGWAVRDGDVFFPFEMRVTGSDRITVPAGAYDCWRIAIRSSAQQLTMWARKSDGVGVRVLETRQGVVRESVLLSEVKL